MTSRPRSPQPVHLLAAGVIAVCGGPMIVLLLGEALQGLARLAGWVS
jgi:hypothetical protein